MHASEARAEPIRRQPTLNETERRGAARGCERGYPLKQHWELNCLEPSAGSREEHKGKSGLRR
eukprot:2969065-Pyramimonas_sp.AAC.1